MNSKHFPSKHILRSILLIAMALSFLWAQQTQLTNAQNPTLELTKSIFNDLTEIESGSTFQYILSYRCATQNCENTTITDVLPPEVEYVGLVTTPDIDSATYDAGTHTVTFVFNDPFPAGSSGILRINAKFPAGTLPGTVATNDATIDASNASSVTSDPVDITSTGQFEMTPQKSLVGEAVAGFPMDFEVSVCGFDTVGGVNLLTPTFIDQLPPDAQFVTAEGTEGVDWTYDSDAHTVTFTNLPTATVNPCIMRTVTLIYDTLPTPTTQTNTLTVTGTPEGCTDPGNLPAHCGGQTERTLGPVAVDFTVIAPYARLGGGKFSSSASSFLGTEALPGEMVTYTVSAQNTGYLTMTNVIITDIIPTEVEVTSFTVAPASDPNMSGFYQSQQTSGWQPLPGNPYATATTINVTDLGLAGGDFVTALRWDIGTLPVPAADWSAAVITTVDVDETAGTIFQNCANVTSDSDSGSQNVQNCRNVSVIDQRAIPRTRKSANSGPYFPGQEVLFTAKIGNEQMAQLNLENPTIADLLPVEFEFVTGTYTVTALPAGAPEPNFVSIADYNGTGQHLLRWTWDDESGSGGTDARYSLPPGEEMVVQFMVRIVDDAAPRRYHNHVALTNWDGPSNILLCDDPEHPDATYIDTNDLDGDGNTTEQGCQNVDAEGYADVGVFLSMGSKKSVQGQLDSDWNGLGLTIPGGSADYQLVITNTSNVSITNLVMYDILPYIGDTAVIDTSVRESEWRPNLQGPVIEPMGIPLTVYYSFNQNPCRPELIRSGPLDCVNDWTTTFPTNPSSVQAIKFEFCEEDDCLELARNASVELTWPMTSPNEAPTHPSCNNPFDPNDPLQFKIDNPACQIAWNSFAFTAEHEESGLSLLPSEPLKVGIRVTDDANLSLGDFVWQDIAGIQNDGVQQAEEKGINGVRVELYDADTDTFLDYRITATNANGAPGYYMFSDLLPDNYYVRFFPAGQITSPANQGSDDTLDSDGETAGTAPIYGSYLQSADITLGSDDITWDQGLWVEVDYGDAPNPYPTETSSVISPSLAARHIIVDEVYLGAGVDAETDGQPTTNANGDDTSENDDEDGVMFASFVGTPAEPVAIMAVGQNTTIQISATIPSTMNGYLNAWLDFNRDGDWDDAGEQIATNVSPTVGVINLTVPVPSDAQIGTSYARFRFGSEQDLLPTGTAINGEVEDYRVQLVAAPEKSIVATSENHTGVVSGIENLAIGEIVRYRLVTQLPETTQTLMQLQDNLPNNLQFMNDGTAMVAFVSNGTLASDRLDPAAISCDGGANPNLVFTGDETTIDSITPECVLPNGAVSSDSSNGNDADSYGNGTDIYFKLGTVTNSDGDENQEFVIVEFNALLLNDSTSQANVTRSNTFAWRVDNNQDGDSEDILSSNSVTIRIAEPEFTLDKSLSSTSVDAGDTVTYTLTYQNSASGSSAATAFEVVLSDTLDASYLILDLGSINIVTTAPVTNTVNNSAGNNINVAIEGMEPSASVTIQYAAILNSAVTAGQLITNTADLVYTSLPGDGTTGNPTGSDTPGASGDADGERNGDDPSGVNDYTVSDSEVLTVNEGTLAKLLVNSSAAHTTDPNVTIGEVVTYSLIIDVPEGTVPSLQVIDDLPAGLTYINSSITVDTTGFNGTVPAPTVSNDGGSGDDVTIDFGTITVNVDNDPSNNSFTIQLQAVVVDVASNVGVNPPGQTTLTNNASVQIGSASPQSATPVDVTVVEPQMEIVKTMTPSAARVGDTVTVTLAISNTGSSTAFEVTMADVIPTGMIYTPATLTQLSGPTVVLDDTGAPTLTAAWDTFTTSDSSVIQFQVTIDNNPPTIITNTAIVDQATTLPGTDPNERDEPDVQDDATVTIPVVVGDRVWYDNDFDGQQDDIISEPGVEGVLVTVYDAATGLPVELTPGIPYTDVTDANGDYFFDQLPVGDYYLIFDLTTLPAGYIPTSANQGDDTTDSDADSNGQTSSTGALASGDENLTLDLGIVPPAAIGNYLWVDENSDGYQDAGEAGIPNITIELWDATHTTLLLTTTTDANGGYLFDDLVPGSYQVDVEQSTLPAGMSQTALNLPNADLGNQDHSNGDGTEGYEVTVGAGEENLTADFGYNHNSTTDVDNPTGSPNGALGDRIWVDSDADGVQDPNEIGVSGAEVTLYHDRDGDGIYNTPYTIGGYTPTATTDENGNYLFDDLPPGSYVVGVTGSSSASHNILSSTDYTQTGDPDHFATDSSNAPAGSAGDNLSTQAIALAPGDVYLNVDFGYQPTSATLGSIGDTIFFDADADGNGPSLAPVDGGTPVTQGAGGTADSDEYGIPNVTVSLIQDSNGNGLWDAGEPIIATDITDENGQYLFDDLPITNGAGSDDYLVWVNDSSNVLDGLTPTYDADGLTTPATGFVSGANISAVSDLDNTPLRSQDFGYTPQGQHNGEGLIGDTIWFDMDNSGTATPDAGEPGIEGIIVTLTNSSGNLITTITDENGHYYFGGLDASATYTVTIAPENFQAGGVLEGMSETYDPDDNTANQSVVSLSTDPDGIDLDQDFSYRATTPHRLGNLVWLDLDADGTYDPVDGERPIGGVTVDLYRDLNGNGALDAGEPLIATTVTDSTINAGPYGTDGNYSFDGLPDGNYIVDVSDRHGLLAGHWHSDGPNDGTDNNSQVDPYSVTINGADNLTADFGYYVDPAAVGNYVWLDINSNGLQDSNETGIPNVVVTLVIDYPDDSKITVTTLTDANGHYSFGKLLLDEDYNGDGPGDEPSFTILISTTQTALSGYEITTIDINSNANDLEDSDDPTGVTAQPVQGQTDNNALSPVTNEPVIASYDFGFKVVPLAIELYKFAASCNMEAGEITLDWQTVYEGNNIGFHLYRGYNLNEEGERITEGLIPSQAPGSGQGGTYQWLDNDADITDLIYYWLESVEITGTTHRYGPATTCGMSKIYLPILQR